MRWNPGDATTAAALSTAAFLTGWLFMYRGGMSEPDSVVMAAGMAMLPTQWGYWHQADIRANDHERPKRVGACRSSNGLWMTAFSINQTLNSTWPMTFHGRFWTFRTPD